MLDGDEGVIYVRSSVQHTSSSLNGGVRLESILTFQLPTILLPQLCEKHYVQFEQEFILHYTERHA